MDAEKIALRISLLRVPAYLLKPVGTSADRPSSNLELPRFTGDIQPPSWTKNQTTMNNTNSLMGMTDPSSSLEKEFLHVLRDNRIRLPDSAQNRPTSKVLVQPDFYYERENRPGRLHFHRRPASRQSRTTECRPPDSQRIARLWFSGHRHQSRPTNHGSAERASRRFCFWCMMLTGNRSTPSEAAHCYAIGGPVFTEQPRTRPLALFSVASTRVYPLEHQTHA